jgi:DNA-3-methyladenine glycosylase II
MRKALCGICILAGGLSERMRRDKSALSFGSKTLLGHIRAEARKLGLRVRIIRRDLIPRCGPLGGVFTGLKTSQAEAELFLACDMPFVSAGLLEHLPTFWSANRRPVFMASRRRPGFPFLVSVEDLTVVERQIRASQYSVQKLARALAARLLHLSGERGGELFNVNTPAEWETACRRWSRQSRSEL